MNTAVASKRPRIALIHALAQSVQPINEALVRDWPDATRMNLLDDSLSADLAASGRGLDAAMQERFQCLAQYALDCGSDAILFTCSAFGPCIEEVARLHPSVPVLKPNEAMIKDAAALGRRVGLVATFAPTLESMPPEFPRDVPLDCLLAEGALAALNDGNGELHDQLIVAAAVRLAARGCEVIALAQFSMARAKSLVERRTGLPVLTTVDSAVAELKRRLDGVAPRP
jgi:aspartate/glutamate racemase